MDFPATERTQQFYGHGDPAREAVAGKYSSSSFYEESHSSTPGAEVGEGDLLDCSRISGQNRFSQECGRLAGQTVATVFPSTKIPLYESIFPSHLA